MIGDPAFPSAPCLSRTESSGRPRPAQAQSPIVRALPCDG